MGTHRYRIKDELMNLKYLILAVAILSTSACANYLSLPPSGTKFREENAPFASLALVGCKQSKMGHHRFIRQSRQPAFGKISVRPVTVEHDETTKKAAVKAEVEAGKIASGGGGMSSETTIKGRYDIIEAVGDLPSKLNQPRNAEVLKDLANWGKAARIVQAVAIAYDYQMTKDHSFSADVSATYEIYSGKIEVNGSSHKVYTLSDGTVFAYRMYKICWKRDPTRRLIVGEILPDDPGSDMNCPAGSSDDPAQVP